MPPKPDAFERIRRFYKAVDTAPEAAGFGVRLDGRMPRSPEGRPLVLPTAALAELVAAEWAAQGETVKLPAMAATRLAYGALDAIAGRRPEMAAQVAAYAETDLLCYFADGPQALVHRQEQLWSPLLAWAREALGLVFVTVAGVIHQPQPATTIAAVQALAEAEDDFGLAGLAFGAGCFGSAILALALRRGRIDGDEAFHLSRLDETFQEERWGVDAEAAARAAVMAGDAVMLERWFRALG